MPRIITDFIAHNTMLVGALFSITLMFVLLKWGYPLPRSVIKILKWAARTFFGTGSFWSIARRTTLSLVVYALMSVHLLGSGLIDDWFWLFVGLFIFPIGLIRGLVLWLYWLFDLDLLGYFWSSSLQDAVSLTVYLLPVFVAATILLPIVIWIFYRMLVVPFELILGLYELLVWILKLPLHLIMKIKIVRHYLVEVLQFCGDFADKLYPLWRKTSYYGVAFAWLTHLFFLGYMVIWGDAGWLLFLFSTFFYPAGCMNGVFIWLYWLFGDAYIPLVTPVLGVLGYIEVGDPEWFTYLVCLATWSYLYLGSGVFCGEEQRSLRSLTKIFIVLSFWYILSQ